MEKILFFDRTDLGKDLFTIQTMCYQPCPPVFPVPPSLSIDIIQMIFSYHL